MYYQWFGVNCSLNSNYTKQDIDIIIQHIIHLWVEWIRWEFDFFKDTNIKIENYAIKEFNKNNIKVLWVLSGIVPGTLKNIVSPSWIYQPITKNTKKYQQFIYDNIKRHKQYISYRQIWNEPNTKRFRINKPEPKDYVNLIKESASIIKKEQPHALVVSGWIFYDPSQSFLPNYNKNFIKECIILWIDKYIDIYAVHPYSLSCYIWYNNPQKLIERTIKNIESWLKDSLIPTNKEIRITEFWISSTRTFYTSQEKTLIYSKLYNTLKTRNIPFFIRNICDFWHTQHWLWNPEKTFWLLTKDYWIKKEFTDLRKKLWNN